MDSKHMMKVVDYEKHGGPDVLRIKERPKPIVNCHEIMIQVEAIGLNICDTWLRQGDPFNLYGYHACIGYECSGKVTAVGSYACKFKEGDEVCASLEYGGAYAEFVVVPADFVLRIPSGVSLVRAAALPEASRFTVFALSALKNVTFGNTILIHDTAGGIDFIAIQYVKHIGCKVFAVAGTEEKLRICQRLGADVCINYKKEDFCKRVKAETGEKGVDIILDASGRDYFQNNMDCLAEGGSVVISGHKIGSRVDVDLSFLVKKGISIIGADVANISYLEREQIWYDVAAKFWPLIEDGHIEPIIGKIFSFTEVAEAHTALEEGCIPGKLLLVPKETRSREDY
ncbi:uncharacterized protein [Henckelia pumila]|uniref:uncharacterized protein n=1 Tax=Henckelia pumila TaxID=405737 RepID=UPI003C6E7CDD